MHIDGLRVNYLYVIRIIWIVILLTIYDVVERLTGSAFLEKCLNNVVNGSVMVSKCIRYLVDSLLEDNV